MNLLVEVQDVFGRHVGDGHVRDVLYMREVKRMDRAGDFEFEIPSTHTNLKEFRATRIAHLFTLTAGREKVTEAIGQIESVSSRLNPDLGPILRVNCADRMRELFYAVVPVGTSFENANNVPVQIVREYAGEYAMPVGWTLEGHETTRQPISVDMLGDNVLEALITVAETTGEHFRIGHGDRRSIHWIGGEEDIENTGITATTQRYSGPNEDLCRIETLAVTEDSFEMFNACHGYGAAGTEEGQFLDMRNATQWPDGTPLQWGSLVDADTLPKYVPAENGDIIAQLRIGLEQWLVNQTRNILAALSSVIEFQDLRATTKYFSDLRSTANPEEPLATGAEASNLILHAAYSFLKTRARPVYFFDVNVVDLNREVSPGQRMKIDARHVRSGELAVNHQAEMYILEVETTVNERGQKTTYLHGSTVDRWRKNETELTLGAALGTTTGVANLMSRGAGQSAAATPLPAGVVVVGSDRPSLPIRDSIVLYTSDGKSLIGLWPNGQAAAIANQPTTLSPPRVLPHSGDIVILAAATGVALSGQQVALSYHAASGGLVATFIYPNGRGRSETIRGRPTGGTIDANATALPAGSDYIRVTNDPAQTPISPVARAVVIYVGEGGHLMALFANGGRTRLMARNPNPP